MAFHDIVIPELMNVIAEKCDLRSIDRLGQVSKEILNVIDITNIKISKIKKIIPEFLSKYIDFNSKYMLNSINIDIGNKFGITGYIDFFRNNHFSNDEYTTNIIYGYDNIQRFFISVRYKDMITNKHKIVTFFQRYPMDNNYYVSCQSSFVYENMCVTFRFTDNPSEQLNETYEILFKLINEGMAKTENYNYILE